MAMGGKEIAALVANGDLSAFDGPSRQLRDLRQDTKGTLLTGRSESRGFGFG